METIIELPETSDKNDFELQQEQEKYHVGRYKKFDDEKERFIRQLSDREAELYFVEKQYELYLGYAFIAYMLVSLLLFAFM